MVITRRGIILVIFCLAWAVKGKGTCDTGTRRIVGGFNAEEIPFMVSIERSFSRYAPQDGLENDKGSFWCGGSIIEKGYQPEYKAEYMIVLTSATCVKGFELDGLRVLYGSNNASARKFVSPAAVVIHKSYEKQGLHEVFTNLALMIFRNITIPLKPAFIVKEPKTCQHWVAGFGANKTVGKFVDQHQLDNEIFQNRQEFLKRLQVNYVPHEDCKLLLLDEVYDHEVCFSFLNRNVCKGDEGGPLYTSKDKRNYYLRGVISDDNSCGKGTTPLRATDLTHPDVQSWIRSAIATYKLYETGIEYAD